MSGSQGGSWTWREKVRDPRFPAIVVLAAAGAFLATSVSHGSRADLVGGLTVTVVIAVPAALFGLPKWRDERHGPAGGAAVLFVGALAAIVAALIVS